MVARTARFALIWAVWLAGMGPLALYLPDRVSEGALITALLAYFSAPFLLIAWLE